MSFLKHKRKEMTVTGKQTKLKRCLYASAAIAVILSGTVTQTTTQVLAAPINGTHNSVGLDPDTKRTDFEAAATHPDANKSKTSIKINTPDEVVNDAVHRNTAIANNTYKDVYSIAEFIEAWKDGSRTYIEVMTDLPNASFSNGERPNGASVIVQGNGHKIDIGNNTLQLNKITADTNITFANVGLQQNLAIGRGADTLAFIRPNSGVGTKLTVNLHDVTLSRGSSSSSNGVVHGIYATGARVVLSGNNTFDLAGSITRGVGSVEVANDANLTMTRNANDLCIEAFDFDTRPSGSVSQFNGFKMGDRSKADVRQLDGTRTTSVSGSKVEAKNAQPFKGNFDIVQTGDDVTWHQENFGYFTRVLQGAGDYIFGQKNTIEIPRITNGNVMTIAYGKRVIFNAGTNFDVRQALNINSSPIQTVQGSIRFISPNNLHMSILDNNGNVKTGDIIYGTQGAPLYITNSALLAWNGTHSMGVNKPDFSETFNILEADGLGAKINGSNQRNVNLFGKDKGLREFQIDSSDVGEIKINYIDQNGNKVGATDMPLVNGANFVGQSFNLATKEYALDKMPVGYKWAIDEQVYEKAGTGSNGQPDGDSTNDDDNGDRFGQADYAIVPMKGDTYTYNIYVYTEGNPNVTYTYVDPFSGAEIASDKVATVGIEKARDHVPAHVGNTIDWTDKLYTETNVPTGYAYVPSNLVPSTVTQPTKTEVKDATTPIDVRIYVYDPNYKGAVELASVPDIDFGKQLISPKNRGTMYAANFTNDLVVNDDRRNAKDGWNLTVQQSQPLTSTDQKTVLKDTLFFREKDGGALTSLESGAPQLVYEHTSQSGKGVLETVKPTSNWNQPVADGAGFYLKDTGKLKEGDYATVLTWTLTAGPKI